MTWAAFGEHASGSARLPMRLNMNRPPRVQWTHLLVGHHVPHTVAGQQEKAILRGDRHPPHIWFRGDDLPTPAPHHAGLAAANDGCLH